MFGIEICYFKIGNLVSIYVVKIFQKKIQYKYLFNFLFYVYYYNFFLIYNLEIIYLRLYYVCKNIGYNIVNFEFLFVVDDLYLELYQLYYQLYFCF